MARGKRGHSQLVYGIYVIIILIIASFFPWILFLLLLFYLLKCVPEPESKPKPNVTEYPRGKQHEH
jgi:hypothetical protein